MGNQKLRTLVITALLAALTFIGTIIIKIPSPTGGYIHIGDGMVILSGILLGPIYGSLAAGIGSMFADIFSGYIGFAIPTLIIKALAAFFSGILYKALIHMIKYKYAKGVSLLISGLVAGIIVTSGYFIFEAYILSLGFLTGLAGVGFNIIQNIVGIVLAFVLMPILDRVNLQNN